MFASYLKKHCQDCDIITAIDSKNAPYGDRGERTIKRMTEAAISSYIGAIDVIVLACNTATAVAIDYLREKYPEQIFVGFEPMIKTAAMVTRTKKIVVLATNATKKSKRYLVLKRRFGDIDIIEPDCHDWAKKIDDKTISRKNINAVLRPNISGADVIVLACTHYTAAIDEIEDIVGPAIRVIDPFQPVANRIRQIIE